MTNTTQIINDGLNSGKLKMGKCEIRQCKNEGLLYHVANGYICETCLDKVGEALNNLEKRLK